MLLRKRNEERRSLPRKQRVALFSILLIASVLAGLLNVSSDKKSGLNHSARNKQLSLEEPNRPATGISSIPALPAAANVLESDSSRTGQSAITTRKWLLAEAPEFPPTAATTSTSDTAYQDALIDPAIAVDPAIPVTAPQSALVLPGSANVEYRLFSEHYSDYLISSNYLEHGLATQLLQDTATYGHFDFRAALTAGDGTNMIPGSSDRGHYIYLAQRDFALTNNWLMNNEVGDIRARVPGLLSQGYYIRLPEPLIEGVSSEISSADGSLRVSSGTLGTFQGRTFPVFTTDFSRGTTTGLSGTYRLSPAWQTGLQVWDNHDALAANGADSFTSMAGTVRYDGRESGRAQVSLLSNDSGARGFWLDGEKRLFAWQNNLGLYHMDPNLQWVDRNTAVLSNTQGAYWRATTRAQDSYSGIGLDWLQTNVANNPAVATRDNTTLYGNYGYRISYDTNLNGYLSLGSENVSGAALDTRDRIITALGTASTRFSTGSSSWLLGTTSRQGDHEYNRLDASWDHFWNPVAGFSALRTGFLYTQQAGSTDDSRETSVRGGGSWNRDRLNLAATASLGYLVSDTISSNWSSNVVLSLDWRIASAWRLHTDLSYSHNALTLTAGDETRLNATQSLVSLRYDANWGRPLAAVGTVGSDYGRGAVRGVLFMDQNGNGVRDPGEPGVPNVTIMLDRGFATETNANGEFSFTPVPSGTHQLRVNVANVPLPWNVKDERGVDVTVRARDTTTADIPLINLRPN
jgi:hypothetical protein